MWEGVECTTFGTWYTVQHIFTDTNDLHNEETTKEIFQGTGLTPLDLENDPERIITQNCQHLMMLTSQRSIKGHTDRTM